MNWPMILLLGAGYGFFCFVLGIVGAIAEIQLRAWYDRRRREARERSRM